ncbi:MAG: DUF1731 domain-containing protein [Acidimicrobiia bacterium]|jgi:nucleoside-diphosphate-sugar epimerase
MRKILFTGATGVLGRAGVPALIAAGHDVTGIARTDSDRAWLEEVGARPLPLDLFDRNAVGDAMGAADTVIHYATAIPAQSAMPKRKSWEMNDRLRATATGLLVDAAIATGVERFIQQSVTLVYADGGDTWLDEDSPVSPPWEVIDSALTAEDHLARFAESGGTAVVLRLARLYGPGPASSEYVAAVAHRKLPIVGTGRNYVSSIHVEDATTALAAALSAPGGTYNMADDEPMTSADYTGVLAQLLGAPAPRRMPDWVARIALGKAAQLLTTSQRVSNQRFRRATGWAPTYSSARAGWHHIVSSNT